MYAIMPAAGLVVEVAWSTSPLDKPAISRSQITRLTS